MNKDKNRTNKEAPIITVYKKEAAIYIDKSMFLYVNSLATKRTASMITYKNLRKLIVSE